jgi:hypothetical protein
MDPLPAVGGGGDLVGFTSPPHTCTPTQRDMQGMARISRQGKTYVLVYELFGVQRLYRYSMCVYSNIALYYSTLIQHKGVLIVCIYAS